MRKGSNYTSLLLLIISFSAFTAERNIYDLSLEELAKVKVVTAASGFEQNIKMTPASVTIIEAATWQARGAKSLTHALQGAPNVEINTVTIGTSHPKHSIRGLSGTFGQQVVILVDGVPINLLHEGSGPALSELPLQGYKRIEIIRSPGSVVYGADAFGGIINLVSYDIDEQPDEVTLTLGEFEVINLGMNTSFMLDEVKFQFSSTYQKFGDDDERIIRRDLQTFFDEIYNTSASHAPGSINNRYESLALKGKMHWQKIKTYYNGIYGEEGFGGGVVGALDPFGHNTYQHHIAGIDYNLSSLIQETPVKGELTLSTWYQYQKGNYPLTVFPAGAALPIGSDGNINFSAPTLTTFTDGFIGEPGNRTARYHFSLKHLFTLADDHQIRWELGFEKQDYKAFEKKNFGPTVLNGTEKEVDGTLTDVTNTPHVYMPPNKRDFVFVSLQDQWQLSQSWLLNVGARFDNYSDAGSTFNPRLGLNWNASERLTLRVFAGSAFRAPSFTDLYAQNNPSSLGNADVKPEDIITYELGGNFQFTTNLHAELTLFSYRADRLIDFALDEESGTKKTANVGEQQAVGFEWELHWRPIKRLDISSNYSYTDSDDGNRNETANIAKKMAAIVINWQATDKVNMNIASNWVMDRVRPQGNTRAPIKDYTLVTGKVTYRGLTRGLEFSASINNLLDEDIRHPSDGTIADDFPQAGRQWLAEVVYRF
jgi:outer membrane receptor for ferrienterochelin and colicins